MIAERKRLLTATTHLGVDADEVLWGCLPCFLEWHNDTYNTRFTVTDFFTYRWHEVVGCEATELQRRYNAFHACGAGYAMVPEAGAYNALRRITQGLERPPVVITSRILELTEETNVLMHRHFPTIFGEIHFGNHYGEIKRSKSDMCLDAGVTLLVEDNLSYALECAAAGIDVLLYGHGRYPWNATTKTLPPNVLPVATWSEILHALGLNSL